MKGADDAGKHESLTFGDSTELGRFIRKCAVLDPDKELLYKDTLTLQFDFSWEKLMPYSFDSLPPAETGVNRMIIHANPFNPHYPVDQNPDYPKSLKHPFVVKMKNDKTALCDKLRTDQQRYEQAFRTVAVPTNACFIGQYQRIYTDLLEFLDHGNLEHIDSVDKCIALYYLTHKYVMPDLNDICRKRLKRLSITGTGVKATEILNVAEMCSDIELRKLVTVHILLNWGEVKNSIEWIVLRKNSPILAEKVTCLANNIEAQNLGIDDPLCSVVLQFIFQNWSEVQLHNPDMLLENGTLGIIMSCLENDFNCSFLKLKKVEPVEMPSQPVLDVRFYK